MAQRLLPHCVARSLGITHAMATLESRSTLQRLVGPTLAASIAGCAQVYVPPAPESRAFIRFSASVDVIQYFHNGDDCTGPRRFDDADNPFKRPDRTLALPAGQRIAVNLVVVGGGASSCSIAFSFVPQASRHYQADLTLAGERCHARITEPGREPGATAADVALRQVRLSPVGGCTRL